MPRKLGAVDRNRLTLLHAGQAAVGSGLGTVSQAEAGLWEMVGACHVTES